MNDAGGDKAIEPDKETPDAAAEASPAPGNPGWQPGRPNKRDDHRTRGPTCPYRLGF
jgi:hypothetical protein